MVSHLVNILPFNSGILTVLYFLDIFIDPETNYVHRWENITDSHVPPFINWPLICITYFNVETPLNEKRQCIYTHNLFDNPNGFVIANKQSHMVASSSSQQINSMAGNESENGSTARRRKERESGSFPQKVENYTNFPFDYRADRIKRPISNAVPSINLLSKGANPVQISRIQSFNNGYDTSPSEIMEINKNIKDYIDTYYDLGKKLGDPIMRQYFNTEKLWGFQSVCFYNKYETDAFEKRYFDGKNIKRFGYKVLPKAGSVPRNKPARISSAKFFIVTAFTPYMIRDSHVFAKYHATVYINLAKTKIITGETFGTHDENKDFGHRVVFAFEMENDIECDMVIQVRENELQIHLTKKTDWLSNVIAYDGYHRASKYSYEEAVVVIIPRGFHNELYNKYHVDIYAPTMIGCKLHYFLRYGERFIWADANTFVSHKSKSTHISKLHSIIDLPLRGERNDIYLLPDEIMIEIFPGCFSNKRIISMALTNVRYLNYRLINSVNIMEMPPIGTGMYFINGADIASEFIYQEAKSPFTRTLDNNCNVSEILRNFMKYPYI
jgi:hypothetical protein